MKKLFLPMLALGAFFYVAPSFSNSEPVDPSVFIQRFGGRVIGSASSVVPGYTAYLAERDGKQRMFYMAPNGVILYGLIYLPDGSNATQMDAMNIASLQTNDHGVQRALNDAANMIERKYTPEQSWIVVEQTNYIEEGNKKGKLVYIVFDPNCPYCKSLYHQSRNDLGKVRLRWVPVGVLNENSEKKAIKLLNSNKMEVFDFTQINDGKLPSTLTNKDKDRLETNLAALVAANSRQVPTIIYKDKNGAPHVKIGLPSEEEWNKIIGD